MLTYQLVVKHASFAWTISRQDAVCMASSAEHCIAIKYALQCYEFGKIALLIPVDEQKKNIK